MVLKRLPFRPSAVSICSRTPCNSSARFLRRVSTETTSSSSSSSTSTSNNELELDDTEFTSWLRPTEEIVKQYDPVANAASRSKQLPSSRYRFRAPRYYRGPLHPHQPPHPSNPTARDYIPGPFSSPRLSQTYDNILSHDLMVLFYQHIPYGTPKPPAKQRLREWDESSPYHKNRPLRGPRGMTRLDLEDKRINFRNVPKLEAITVSTLVPQGSSDSRFTHTAGMIVQAITTQRADAVTAKRTFTKGTRVTYTQKKGKVIAVGTTMTGEPMWHFLSTFVALVLPKIKEWKGVKVKSGDRNGNFTIGLTKDTVELWPEVAVNYDSYLPHMIPGMSITLTTSATNDRDGKVLLAALGIPFDATGQ